MSDLKLNSEERTRVLVVNALKQWVSKESAYLDTMFTGGQFRKKVKSMAAGRQCPFCGGKMTSDNTELHHTVRDGRPPIPLCKPCHDSIERVRDSNDLRGEDSRVVRQIKDIRSKTNSSWSNLKKGVRAIQELPHEPFGTKNVETSCKSVVRKSMRATGLSLEQLQEIIDTLG